MNPNLTQQVIKCAAGRKIKKIGKLFLQHVKVFLIRV